MLDINLIQRKTKLIQENLSNLGQLGESSFDEIAKDIVKFSALERLLEKIITRAIDINQHIISELSKGNEQVKGYEDTFYALVGLQVYDLEFAKKIAPSAGLRNRLVHEYDNTKDEIVYDSVSDAIAQYAKYCDFVLKFAESKM
jgi:uncharacterized protein YutE (UPF0331/DUF86 family)